MCHVSQLTCHSSSVTCILLLRLSSEDLLSLELPGLVFALRIFSAHGLFYSLLMVNYFHQLGPCGRHVRLSVCLFVCRSVCAIRCSFFEAAHWSSDHMTRSLPLISQPQFGPLERGKGGGYGGLKNRFLGFFFVFA